MAWGSNHAWLTPSPQSWHADMGTAKHMPNHQFRCWGHETYQHLSPQIVEHLWIIDNFSKNIHCQFGQSPGALAALSREPLSAHLLHSTSTWHKSPVSMPDCQFANHTRSCSTSTNLKDASEIYSSNNIGVGDMKNVPPISISHSWAQPYVRTTAKNVNSGSTIQKEKTVAASRWSLTCYYSLQGTHPRLHFKKGM